jgi:hypothetical protein
MNRRQILVGGGAVVAFGGGGAYLAASAMGTAANYSAGNAALRRPLADAASSRDLIRYATLAPNGHNTQPWMFRVADQRIDILPDFTRRTPVVDPDDHHVFVSLGAAAENLSLASAARGLPGTIAFEPGASGSVVFRSKPGRATVSELFDAIPKRQSTRADYDGRSVIPADLDRLTEAAVMPGVDLVLLTDKPRIDRVRELVLEGNSAQMNDPAFMRELRSWLRFNPRQALRTGDGLYTATTGNPAMPDWLGPRAFDLLTTAKSENEKYASQIRSSSGIAVFSGVRADAAHWVAVGQACQRFSLQATALGLKHAFINQPVEVAALRAELAALIGLPGRRPDIVMRFGHGADLPFSARRPARVLAA